MRKVCVIESWTTSASREDSMWNSDWARSQRIAFTMSTCPEGRPADCSSWTTPFSRAATWRAALSVASDERKYVSTPSVADSRCALAWIDTNRSARSRLAKLVRSRRVTKWSASRVRRTLTPSRSSTSFVTRRVTSSTTSFSISPVGPRAPEADQPDARLVGSARLDGVGDRRGRLDDDGGERRIRADREVLQGDLDGRADTRGGCARGRAGPERRAGSPDEGLGHEPHSPLDPHRGIQNHGLAVDQHLGPVPREGDNRVTGTQMGSRARGSRVEPRLERSRHPGELHVRAPVVGDRGQTRTGPARRREQEHDQRAGETSGDHGEANSNNGRGGPGRLTSGK